MAKSFSTYITFTDVNGDYVVFRKSAITYIVQDRDTCNAVIGVAEGCYIVPVTEFITFDSLIEKIFY